MLRKAWGEELRHGDARWRGPLPIGRIGLAAREGREASPGSIGRGTARMLLLDTESTGLSRGTGTLAFLVGLAWYEGNGWHMEQLFLRSPGEERPLLLRLADRLSRADVLLTFNGRGFDWPLLRTRFLLHRIPLPQPPLHVDLLGPARRLLGRALPNVRLQALERALLGFERTGDVPGHEVPARYRAWLRTHDGSVLEDVFLHNALDLKALGALYTRLEMLLQGTWEEPLGFGGLAAARWRWRAGERRAAVHRLERVAREGRSGDARFEAWEQLGRWQRGDGSLHAARKAFESALLEARSPEQAALAHLRLARLLEHRGRSPAAAWPHALASAGAEERWQRERRLHRLRRKLTGARGPSLEATRSGSTQPSDVEADEPTLNRARVRGTPEHGVLSADRRSPFAGHRSLKAVAPAE